MCVGRAHFICVSATGSRLSRRKLKSSTAPDNPSRFAGLSSDSEGEDVRLSYAAATAPRTHVRGAGSVNAGKEVRPRYWFRCLVHGGSVSLTSGAGDSPAHRSLTASCQRYGFPSPLQTPHMCNRRTSSDQYERRQRRHDFQPTFLTTRGGMWSVSSTGSRRLPPSSGQRPGSFMPW